MSNALLALKLKDGREAELHVNFRALDKLSKVGIDPLAIMGRAAKDQDLLTLREAVTVLWVGTTGSGAQLTEEEVGDSALVAGALAIQLAVKYLASFCAAGPARKNE